MTEYDWLVLIAKDPAANLPIFHDWLLDRDDVAGAAMCEYMIQPVCSPYEDKKYHCRRPEFAGDNTLFWWGHYFDSIKKQINAIPMDVFDKLEGGKGIDPNHTNTYDFVSTTESDGEVEAWTSLLNAWRKARPNGVDSSKALNLQKVKNEQSVAG